MKRARCGTHIVKKKSIFDIPKELIENEVFKYLDFYSKINYSMTCKMTSGINKNVNYWEIVHSLPKETLKSAMLCETITYTSLYFAKIRHCSICFKPYNNGTFIKNHGIYAHNNCLKDFYGIYSVNLKSGECKYVTTHNNKTYTDPNIIYFQGFPCDTSLIADNDTKSLQRIVKRLGIESDSSFINRYNHNDLNEFIRQYHIKEGLKRNVKLSVVIGRHDVGVLSLCKDEIDKALSNGRNYSQVLDLIESTYINMNTQLNNIQNGFIEIIQPKLISNTTWYDFIEIVKDQNAESYLISNGWPFDMNWPKYILSMTSRKNIRLFNRKQASKNVVKRLMIFKNIETCQCKVCKNYLIVPSRNKLINFMKQYTENDIKELEDFCVNYYKTCWEFLFKDILNIPRLAFQFDKYVIGKDVFKRLLFPLSIEKPMIEKQLNEFKNIITSYHIKDIRKAIVNNKDVHVFDIENKIKLERDSRVRCCVNRYVSSCKYKLCDSCCMDSQCVHDETDDGESYTETETDSDSDTDMDTA